MFHLHSSDHPECIHPELWCQVYCPFQDTEGIFVPNLGAVLEVHMKRIPGRNLLPDPMGDTFGMDPGATAV